MVLHHLQNKLFFFLISDYRASLKDGMRATPFSAKSFVTFRTDMIFFASLYDCSDSHCCGARSRKESSNPRIWNILVVEVVKKSLSAFVGGLCIGGSSVTMGPQGPQLRGGPGKRGPI